MMSLILQDIVCQLVKWTAAPTLSTCGSCKRRSVWPVGAVSKTSVEYSPESTRAKTSANAIASSIPGTLVIHCRKSLTISSCRPSVGDVQSHVRLHNCTVYGNKRGGIMASEGGTIDVMGDYTQVYENGKYGLFSYMAPTTAVTHQIQLTGKDSMTSILKMK